jgi:hypothetical protein
MPQIFSGSWQTFSEAKKRLMAGEISLTGHLFRVALMLNTWVPNLHTQSNWSQINGHELSTIGYSAGGNIILGKTLTRYDAQNKTTWDADIITIGPFPDAVTVKYAVIYDDSHSTDSLLCYCLLNANGDDVEGLKFDILFNAGILNLS